MGISFWISIISDVSTQFFSAILSSQMVTTCSWIDAFVKIDRMGLRSRYNQDGMVLRETNQSDHVNSLKMQNASVMQTPTAGCSS